MPGFLACQLTFKQRPLTWLTCRCVCQVVRVLDLGAAPSHAACPAWGRTLTVALHWPFIRWATTASVELAAGTRRGGVEVIGGRSDVATLAPLKRVAMTGMPLACLPGPPGHAIVAE